MLTEVLATALAVFSLVVLTYFVLWNVSQMVMGLMAWGAVGNYLRIRTRRDRTLARRLSSPPPVSIIVPAYNEGLTIVASIHALLSLDYEAHEIIVVNDGSSDNTLATLKQVFHLVPAPLAFARPLPSAPVRGIYRSVREPALIVVDKQNSGSKADALNAGVNAASGLLVLMIDADTVLAPDALSRGALPFLEDPDTVAVGGNVAIANGCRIEHGRITNVSLPRSWLARFQIIEYTRSFLLYRMACVSLNALTLISGAFGLFRRDSVIAVGGLDGSAIGEDLDLTLRLHRYYRELRLPYRIAFDPFPVCSTQVPEDWVSLRNQRCRWRRGLLGGLWRHRQMIGRPRFGALGLGTLPYVTIFEGLGPLLELTGYILLPPAAMLGLLNWQMFLVLVATSILFGTATTLMAVFLSDVATRRYMRGADLIRLLAAALLENCGYRQLNAWWGCVGTFQTLTGARGWGIVRRRVFEREKKAA
jgi:cellulose synthase/poly-beta-1,6-N-acetylglucosamine synthase-like glycosyltransferase